MNVSERCFLCLSVMFCLGLAAPGCKAQEPGPQPRHVEAGKSGQAPSDAVALFNGKDLSNWTTRDGKPAGCTASEGVVSCKTGVGDLVSKQKFGDAQIHIEFNIPSMPGQHGQARGNSGVYVQGRYEIQVLDSYNNPTYANGSCGALYGQYAPLVNASLPPEQWQTYDIIFHPPKCDAQGHVTSKGRLTMMHNGILIHDHVEIQGPTPAAVDNRVCEPGPLLLQDHDVKGPMTVMKFRNAWFRPLNR